MMATDPFDPDIDRALDQLAAVRAESESIPSHVPPVVLTLPTLFGPVDIAVAPSCPSAHAEAGCEERHRR